MIKTKRFDSELNDVINVLKINRNNPVKFIGSYPVNDWGSLITDIDTQSSVFYNNKLLDILYSILNRTQRNPKLHFVNFDLGAKKEFIYPWSLNDDGSCSFDIDKAQTWYQQMLRKKLIPKDVAKQVGEILYSNNIKIGDIVQIQFLLLPYSDINWTLEDIKRKSKVVNGTQYDLLELMKEEVPIFEFVYTPDGINYVPIEYALVDYKYKKQQKSGVYGIFNKFYTNNKYGILKYLRWKIKPEYREEYFELFKNIEKYRYILSRLDMYDKLVFFRKRDSSNVLTISKSRLDNIIKSLKTHLNKMVKGRDFNIATDELNSIVDNAITESITYFSDDNKIQDRYKTEIKQKFARGNLSQRGLTENQLRKRKKLGIKCPFFTTDMSDYDFLSSLATRLMLDPDNVIDCVYKIADKYNITLSDVIEKFKPNNSYYIIETVDKFLLRDRSGKTLKKISKTKDNLRNLQYQVFTMNE